MDSPTLRTALAVMTLAGVPSLAAAQRAAPVAQSGYGTDDLQVVTLPMTRFLPLQSTGSYSSVCCFGSTGGERWPTGGDQTLSAAIDAGLIPNGAIVERIDFFVRDDDGFLDRNFRGLLCRTWVDATSGATAAGECPVDLATNAAPGETVLTGTPGLPVRYTGDADGDTDLDSVSYHVFARFGVNAEQVFDGSIRLRMVRLFFRRQVSPAPATATFGDVPADHPFFQFVEALAASGITAGCGSGVYCPDAPLTRGQMAVFLAKALGLHWPAPAAP